MQITQADHPRVYSPSLTTPPPTRHPDRDEENTTNFRLYVTVIINCVMTNDDAINISKVPRT